MELTRIDHFTIRADHLEKTRAFYEASLGLSTGWRPNFPFPGYWLYRGSHAVLHLAAPSTSEQVGLPNGTGGLVDYLGTRTGEGSGAVDHIALRAVGAKSYVARLGQEGIAFRHRVVPELKELQIFIEDPNGITIEVIFSSDEAAGFQDARDALA